MQEHVVSIGDWTEIPFDLPAGTSFLVGGLACLFACDEKGKGGAYSGLGVPCCFFLHAKMYVGCPVAFQRTPGQADTGSIFQAVGMVWLQAEKPELGELGALLMSSKLDEDNKQCAPSRNLERVIINRAAEHFFEFEISLKVPLGTIWAACKAPGVVGSFNL